MLRTRPSVSQLDCPVAELPILQRHSLTASEPSFGDATLAERPAGPAATRAEEFTAAFFRCRAAAEFRGQVRYPPLGEELTLVGAASRLSDEISEVEGPIEYIADGFSTVVVGTTDRAIRIVRGAPLCRQEDVDLLPAEKRGAFEIKGYRYGYEILERTTPICVFEYDVFTAKIHLAGKHYGDLQRENLGRLGTGRLIAIDPGGGFSASIESSVNHALCRGVPYEWDPPLIKQIHAWAAGEGFERKNPINRESYLRLLHRALAEQPDLHHAVQEQIHLSALRRP